MKTVNALKIRNHLGEVLDILVKTGEPILVSKGRQVKAVLITPEDFQTRFLDVQSEEERKKFIKNMKKLRSQSTVQKSSLAILRQLRGYTA